MRRLHFRGGIVGDPKEEEAGVEGIGLEKASRNNNRWGSKIVHLE